MFRQTISRMKKMSFRYWMILIYCCLGVGPLFADWRELREGLEYQRLDFVALTPWSHIHIFRMTPNQNHLKLLMAKDFGKKHTTVYDFLHHSLANIVVNGGFFDHAYHPLGLRADNGVIKNPVKPISWWGVFYVRHGKAHLSKASHFVLDEAVEFAIQSGPRLLVAGRIPPLKPGRAERSALGITKEGKIILVVTENMPLSTEELAKLMQAEPIYARYALNLDGGSSTQLAARVKGFYLSIRGFSEITDAIGIFP